MPLTTFPAVPTQRPGGLQCRLSSAGLSTPLTWAAGAQSGWLVGQAVLWWHPGPPSKDVRWVLSTSSHPSPPCNWGKRDREAKAKGSGLPDASCSLVPCCPLPPFSFCPVHWESPAEAAAVWSDGGPKRVSSLDDRSRHETSSQTQGPSLLLPDQDLTQSQEGEFLKGKQEEPSKAQGPLGPWANSEWSSLSQKSTQSAKAVYHASPLTFPSCPSATPLAWPLPHTLVHPALCGSRTTDSEVQPKVITAFWLCPWPPSRHLCSFHPSACLLPGVWVLYRKEKMSCWSFSWQMDFTSFCRGDETHMRLLLWEEAGGALSTWTLATSTNLHHSP